MKNNNICSISFDFAVEIVKLVTKIQTEQNEYVLTKQILRSGTSIGANAAEAQGGISKADFSAKLSISYKEALETSFWLDLLFNTNYIDEDCYHRLHSKCDELSAILYSIIKKCRPR